MKALVWLAGIMVLAVAAAYMLSLLCIIAGTYGTYRGGRALWGRHHERVARRGHQRAELLARAEIQDRWFMDGDPRGTYGRYTPAGPR